MAPPSKTLEDVLHAMRDAVEFFDVPVQSVGQRGVLGATPLIVAAGWGDPDAVRILLDAGAEIDATGEDDDTALHRAIAVGAFEVARILIERGASTETEDVDGYTQRALGRVAEDKRIRALFELGS